MMVLPIFPMVVDGVSMFFPMKAPSFWWISQLTARWFKFPLQDGDRLRMYDFLSAKPEFDGFELIPKLWTQPSLDSLAG